MSFHVHLVSIRIISFCISMEQGWLPFQLFISRTARSKVVWLPTHCGLSLLEHLKVEPYSNVIINSMLFHHCTPKLYCTKDTELFSSHQKCFHTANLSSLQMVPVLILLVSDGLVSDNLSVTDEPSLASHLSTLLSTIFTKVYYGISNL